MAKAHKELSMTTHVLFTFQFTALSMEHFGQIYVNQILTILDAAMEKEKI